MNCPYPDRPCADRLYGTCSDYRNPPGCEQAPAGVPVESLPPQELSVPNQVKVPQINDPQEGAYMAVESKKSSGDPTARTEGLPATPTPAGATDGTPHGVAHKTCLRCGKVIPAHQVHACPPPDRYGNPRELPREQVDKLVDILQDENESLRIDLTRTLAEKDQAERLVELLTAQLLLANTRLDPLRLAVEAAEAYGYRYPVHRPRATNDPLYSIVNVAVELVRALQKHDPPQHNDACCIVNPTPGLF